MSEKRENGWYWVFLKDDDNDPANGWQIGLFHNGWWALVGFEYEFRESDFAKIGARISKPTE